jgi:hypothetical protein
MGRVEFPYALWGGYVIVLASESSKCWYSCC